MRRCPQAGYGTGNGEKFLPLRQFYRLKLHLVGRAKGFMHRPFRTGAAKFGKLHTASGKALGNITCIINTDKEKGDSARGRRIQAGQAMTYLFKASTKASSKQVNIITQ